MVKELHFRTCNYLVSNMNKKNVKSPRLDAPDVHCPPLQRSGWTLVDSLLNSGECYQRPRW